MDRTLIFWLMESPHALREKVKEAIEVLRDWIPQQYKELEKEAYGLQASMLLPKLWCDFCGFYLYDLCWILNFVFVSNKTSHTITIVNVVCRHVVVTHTKMLSFDFIQRNNKKWSKLQIKKIDYNKRKIKHVDDVLQKKTCWWWYFYNRFSQWVLSYLWLIWIRTNIVFHTYS